MSQSGHTLVELAVVLAVFMILLTAAAPSFRVAIVHTEVDRCAGKLRSIWNAQRAHWLEHRRYARSLDVLVAAGGLDAAVADAADPFAFSITAAGVAAFRASAVRAGTTWSGALAIDERGTVSGYVQDSGRRRVRPPKK